MTAELDSKALGGPFRLNRITTKIPNLHITAIHINYNNEMPICQMRYCR